MEFSIPASNLDALTGKLDTLIRKAQRLHLPVPSYTVGERVVETRIKSDPTLIMPSQEIQVVVYPVAISGISPKINGFTLIAVIEHLEDENIVRSIPGMTTESELVAYRTVAPYCDHCKLIRRRNDTYILREDETGAYKQVGRSCLKDFTGYDSLEDIAGMYLDVIELCEHARDEYDYDMPTNRGIKLEDYLLFVSACMHAYGWVSKSVAREKCDGTASTADQALSEIEDTRKGKTDVVKPDDTDKKRVQAAIAWIRVMATDSLNDYLYNLYTVCKHDFCIYRHCGIAASLIAAYERATAQEIEKKTQRATSQYRGVVGKRSTFNGLTCTLVKDCESYYGVTYLHKFVDQSGNVYTWFSSSEKLDQGSTYDVTGSVKAHEEYQGIAQTVLTRCKVKQLVA